MFFDIDKTWEMKLLDEFKKSYMLNLIDLIKNNNNIIYPNFKNIFFCLKITPLNMVKVVILGQDPYCQEGQADGLAFSVPKGVVLPASLKNIYKELNDDLGISISNNGCLLKWSKQGVLLLNTVLTVEKNKPGSHYGCGWEIFTDKIISLLSSLNKKIIFLLLGKKSLSKLKLINLETNTVIYSSHPSDKSAFLSFFGSRPFSKINMHLKIIGENQIDWINE